MENIEKILKEAIDTHSQHDGSFPSYKHMDGEFKRILLEAMEEYATLKMERFADFVGDRPLPEFSKSTGQWRWWDNTERLYKYATTPELIEQFLNATNTPPQ